MRYFVDTLRIITIYFNQEREKPLAFVRDPILVADVMFLMRRALLLFFEAVCITDFDELKSLRKVARNHDLVRHMALFM